MAAPGFVCAGEMSLMMVRPTCTVNTHGAHSAQCIEVHGSLALKIETCGTAAEQTCDTDGRSR